MTLTEQDRDQMTWGSQTEHDTGATDSVGAAIDLLVTLARVY